MLEDDKKWLQDDYSDFIYLCIVYRFGKAILKSPLMVLLSSLKRQYHLNWAPGQLPTVYVAWGKAVYHSNCPLKFIIYRLKCCKNYFKVDAKPSTLTFGLHTLITAKTLRIFL